MKRQLGEYESKIKKLIIEFEGNSKKHNKELNKLHEQYIGNKTNEMVLKQRIKQYKMVQETGLQGQKWEHHMMISLLSLILFMRQSYLYYNQEDDETDRQWKNPSKRKQNQYQNICTNLSTTDLIKSRSKIMTKMNKKLLQRVQKQAFKCKQSNQPYQYNNRQDQGDEEGDNHSDSEDLLKINIQY
ncbi:UNKNOWN [Stylonychia lemnae]|uniref:Uncharacterized protein n=1 Tax=Stylonychia lemnae TaxID=5949 RepID=A0A078B0Z1_STYLE|nr:UNKNOWN [Stylonychia lemnae]|eukprot:CDW88229.1 UNKNOWN [Stylonychia lemnae]